MGQEKEKKRKTKNIYDSFRKVSLFTLTLNVDVLQ